MCSQMIVMMMTLCVHIVKRQPSRRDEKGGRSRAVRSKIVVMDNSQMDLGKRSPTTSKLLTWADSVVGIVVS